jgi:predicted DNA-binding protein (MmcQ/YjbR family)
MAQDARSLQASLLELALGLPGAWRDQPWEDDVVAKVGKKIFVFFGTDADPGLSVKLPESADLALGHPGAEPTGYGLGRHGWVSIRLRGRDRPPRGVLEDWIEESYRAIAPKKLVAELDARA